MVFGYRMFETPRECHDSVLEIKEGCLVDVLLLAEI